MKTKSTNQSRYVRLACTLAALTLIAPNPLVAEAKEPDGHDHQDAHHAHEHKAQAGPNGGRVLHNIEPHLEFFVTADRKVRITALDDAGKAIPMAGQSVKLVGGERTNPTRMNFTIEGDVLVSDKAFPDGNHFPIVLQIKTTADAKTVFEKFNLDMTQCATCEYAEYACTCEHEEHDHAGHDH